MEKKILIPLESKMVLKIYETLGKENLVSFLPAEDSEAKIDSALSSIFSIYFGNTPYPTTEQKAVAILYYLINDHPFVDGNKRTAIISFMIFCETNKLKRGKTIFLDELAVAIEKLGNKDQSHEVIDLITELLFDTD